MEISVNLEFGDGDFERGFPQIKLQATDAQHNSRQLEAQLPPAPEIPVSYQIWKDKFDSLLKNSRGGFKKNQVTNLSTAECYQLDGNLCHHLHQWLNPIKSQLESVFHPLPLSEIRLIIHTQNIVSEYTKDILHRLPWQEWDLFPGGSLFEASLDKSTVSILTILASLNFP